MEWIHLIKINRRARHKYCTPLLWFVYEVDRSYCKTSTMKQEHRAVPLDAAHSSNRSPEEGARLKKRFLNVKALRHSATFCESFSRPRKKSIALCFEQSRFQSLLSFHTIVFSLVGRLPLPFIVYWLGDRQPYYGKRKWRKWPACCCFLGSEWQHAGWFRPTPRLS